MPNLTAKTRQEKGLARHLTFKIVRNGNVTLAEHTLLVNPEEYQQDEGARVSVTRTLGGAYVEEWGRDLINFTIKGTTGYAARRDSNGRETDGFQAFKELRNNIYRYFLEPDGRLKQYSTDKYELLFYNWEDGEYYAIMPQRFALNRSKSRPLLYAYDFSFIALHPISKPSASSDVSLAHLSDFGKLAVMVASNLLSQTDNLRVLLGGLA